MAIIRVGDASSAEDCLPTFLRAGLAGLSPPAASLLDFFALLLDALMRESGFTPVSPAARGDAGRRLVFEYRLLPPEEAVEGKVGHCRLRVYSAGPTVLVYGTFLEAGLDSFRAEQTFSYHPGMHVVDTSPDTSHDKRFTNLRELRRRFVDEVVLRMLCHVCALLDLAWPVGHLTQLPEPALREIFLSLTERRDVHSLLLTCKTTAMMAGDQTMWKALVKRRHPSAVPEEGKTWKDLWASPGSTHFWKREMLVRMK